MLGFPLMWAMPDDVRQNDLEWYETVTYPEGPAMTWGVFSTGWLDLGQFTKADELFTKAYSSYAREPFKVRCALPTTHPLTRSHTITYISIQPSTHPFIHASIYPLNQLYTRIYPNKPVHILPSIRQCILPYMHIYYPIHLFIR